MRYILLILLLFILTPRTVGAQTTAGEVTQKPICFQIHNEAPYSVHGEISTNHYTKADGTKTRHTGVFRLKAAGTLHKEKGYPLDITEFCSSGPFYPDRQLEITLRALFPIFSCKTSIEIEDIVIKGKYNKDGTTKTWAICY